MKNMTIDQIKESGFAAALIFSIASLYLGNFLTIMAIITLIFSMTIPVMLKPFAYFWFGLSIILGNIMSKVLVSIIYILIVIPFGLLMKAVNKDAMKLNEFKKDKTSLFIKKNHLYTTQDIINPY